MSMLIKKIAVLTTLAVIAIAYLGWLPKEKASRFVHGMAAIFLFGFVWRVGAWLLSL